jgi:phosphohistidine phosphatase SixA
LSNVHIHLLRAGRAIDGGVHLTLQGRQQIRAIGSKVHKAFAPNYTLVVSGADPACLQSAELFADRTSYLGVIEVWKELALGVPSALQARLVVERAKGSSASAVSACVLMVGEEPWLSELGAALIGRLTFPQPMHAQLCAIEDSRPAWFLRADAEAPAPLLVANA